MQMRIIIGANHRGIAVRNTLVEMLGGRYDVVDCGVFDSTPVDYPVISFDVAGKVSRGEGERGILIGGVGIGMVIVANKFTRVRAVLCHDEVTAEISRSHCDCNVLCLSAELTAQEMIRRIVETWLQAPFEGGRHARRVAEISRLEDQYMKRA
jgi:ribose 5-phosphate isomerase B